MMTRATILSAVACLALAPMPGTAAAESAEAPAEVRPATVPNYLVQAASVAQAAEAVRAVGGIVVNELAIIDAVGAVLTTEQAEQLVQRPGIRLHGNRNVEVSGKPTRSSATTTTTTTTDAESLSFTDGDGVDRTQTFETNYPALVGARTLRVADGLLEPMSINRWVEHE